MSIQRNLAETRVAPPAEEIVRTFIRSVEGGHRVDAPYRHWLLEDCLPEDTVDDILALPFPAPDLGGVSGKRELHNNTRRYFDEPNRAAFPVCDAFAHAFQDPRLTDRLARTFGTELKDTYLRIEFAQDTDGFWLEPHTDLGVKRFTLLLYLSRDEAHRDLGTDIYDAGKVHVGRAPFAPNAAMLFVPSDITFHGFEMRPIAGVRKSLVVNYVTQEWRAREQLAFPEEPVS